MSGGGPVADVIVIGGGLVGAALAYGLSREGQAVTLLDEGDNAFRASRGNFGLVWVQGKGSRSPAYARWTRASADLWPAFATQLLEETAIDVGYRKPGGLTLCMSEAEMESRCTLLQGLRTSLHEYDFQMLDRLELRELLPAVGETVVGASFCPHDGHVSPLLLLRALHQAILDRVAYRPGEEVIAIERRDGLFHVRTRRGTRAAIQLVLAAGLGNAKLAPRVGLQAPVVPVRGQILVTERLQPFLPLPTMQVRQTEVGTVMLGDSHEEVGFDVSTTVAASRDITRRAIAQFPFLGDVQMIRTWGALRVMTADGLPIYEQSQTHPGAYIVTCHSGVTLAAVHAKQLAPAIARGDLPPELDAFCAERSEECHVVQAQ